MSAPTPPASATLPSPARAIPSSGSLRLRIRYCECDPMGVAHHAAFISWLEMGRTELLRDAGISYAQLEAAGVFLVIVKLECRYKRPGRYDDLVEVRTSVTGGSRVKIQHEYEVWTVERVGPKSPHVHAHELLCTASSTLACVDATGKVRELPDWLMNAKNA